MNRSWTEPVISVPGVPRWFTRLRHVTLSRHCRAGHIEPLCGRCGYVADVRVARILGIPVQGSEKP